MNDSKSRALLTTALHPSSSPNERLMALAAFNRIMERAGLHASDIAIVDVSGNGPRGDDGMAKVREAARRDEEILVLGRRVKAQEKALRDAGREAADLRRTITVLEATIARRENARDDDACQIAALEADLAARNHRIAALEAENRALPVIALPASS